MRRERFQSSGHPFSFFQEDRRKKKRGVEGNMSPTHPKPFERKPNRVELRKRDFRSGPVVISEPDTHVVFMEDIEFNFPDVGEDAESPFHLGHFAGLLVGAERVYIDLNRKRVMQSPHMRARQRFFSLIELDVTPFPVKPGLGFTTKPKSPSDITVANGTLGESSHFCIHGATAGDRILISNVRMYGYEVGAISISGAADVDVVDCSIGRPSKPSTSSEVAMFKDLARECRKKGMKETATQLDVMCAHPKVSAPESTDAICRAIVIAPVMNVGLPDLKGKVRTRRIRVSRCSFDSIRAEPKEVIGVSTRQGGDPIKDLFGNLVLWEDAMSGSLVSRTQASLTKPMPMRDALMRGSPVRLHQVKGFDLRGHALQQKSSAFIRIDGADDVTVSDVKGAYVKSKGSASAAVGVMINACKFVTLEHIRLAGVSVTDPSPLSDDRPQSGIYLRHCSDVTLYDIRYDEESACACVLRNLQNAKMVKCKFNAPFTALHSRPLTYSSQ